MLFGLFRAVARLALVGLFASAGVSKVYEQSHPLARASGAANSSTTSPLISNGQFTGSWFVSIAMNNRSHGYVVSRNGWIMKTADGGQSWSQIVPPNQGPDRWFRDVASPSPQIVWIVGNGGLILKSTDGGETWANQPCHSTADLFGITAVNDQQAWAVGSDGTVLSTANGGQTWASHATKTQN